MTHAHNRWPALRPILAAGILASLLVPLDASARAECTAAFATGTWINNVLDRNPEVNMQAMDNAEREVFVRGFNRLPPPTNFSFEGVYVFTMLGSPVAVVAFAQGGCVVFAQEIPVVVVERLKRPDGSI